MGRLHWYRRNPNKALVGMKGLTLEERGAYNTVLDLIYAHDGAIDDDERFIAGWLSVDVRVWRRLRARLIDLGKLYVADGALRNSAADVEVDRGLSRLASAQDAGKASARKRGAVPSEHNDLASTPVAATVATTKSQNKKEAPSLRSGGDDRPGKPSRGTRLDESWIPDSEGQSFAAKTLGSIEAARAEFLKFRDHWKAQPGSKGVKTDWPATWRNWCRKAVEMRGNRGPPARASQPSFHEIASQIRGTADEIAPNELADAGSSTFDFDGAASGLRER